MPPSKLYARNANGRKNSEDTCALIWDQPFFLGIFFLMLLTIEEVWNTISLPNMAPSTAIRLTAVSPLTAIDFIHGGSLEKNMVIEEVSGGVALFDYDLTAGSTFILLLALQSDLVFPNPCTIGCIEQPQWYFHRRDGSSWSRISELQHWCVRR
jgi:hypothetical protein